MPGAWKPGRVGHAVTGISKVRGRPVRSVRLSALRWRGSRLPVSDSAKVRDDPRVAGGRRPPGSGPKGIGPGPVCNEDTSETVAARTASKSTVHASRAGKYTPDKDHLDKIG